MEVDLKYYAHQISGFHYFWRTKILFCKEKLYKYPYNKRELAFYKTGSKSNEIQTLIPKYYGIYSPKKENNQKIHDYLCIENLTWKMKQPRVMEIKIGSLVSPIQSFDEQKVGNMTQNYPQIENHGFQIIGIKTNKLRRNKFCSRHNFNDLLDIYFMYDNVKPPNITYILYTICKRFNNFIDFFTSKKCQWSFFSASLLIICDIGENVKKSNNNEKVKMKLIDFAHAFKKDELSEYKYEDKMVLGLKSLHKLFLEYSNLVSVHM